MMRYSIQTAIGFALCTIGSVSLGADFDVSKPFICAPVEALNCSPTDGCAKGLPDEFGAPNFMRFDLAKKEVIGPKRTSSIRFIEKDADQTLLQGTELGFAWTVVLDPQGRMTSTLASGTGTFVLFGSCTML